MANPFGTDTMASGYANSRPPMHSKVMERARNFLPLCHRALDVGCGSGLSTRALAGYASERIGIEPAESMTRLAAEIVPDARFLVGRAEALPVAPACIDLITAAGSLNYADVGAFFAEARRVLAPAGRVMVYDFSAGRSFPSSGELDAWFTAFRDRYPSPPNEALFLDPQRLQSYAPDFRTESQEYFEVTLSLDHDFYINYMLTETNVAAAVRRGEPLDTIGHWCETSLNRFWQAGNREVVFRGYYVIFV